MHLQDMNNCIYIHVNHVRASCFLIWAKSYVLSNAQGSNRRHVIKNYAHAHALLRDSCVMGICPIKFNRIAWKTLENPNQCTVQSSLGLRKFYNNLMTIFASFSLAYQFTGEDMKNSLRAGSRLSVG